MPQTSSPDSVRFDSLGLAKPILDAVTAEGYDRPTPIQAASIPPILEGRDMLGCAQTGTGKTAAFALPVLHHLHTARRTKKHRGPVLPRALILSPTRELATQIAESFSTYGHRTGLRLCVIFGGVKQNPQVRRLQSGADIIVATPGRLLDLMNQGYVNLSGVQHFVLDEADRMLDMGFIDPIRRVCAALPKRRQTLLFSATMPKDIARLADSVLTDPVKVAVDPVASAAPKIEQSLYLAEQDEKLELLSEMLAENAVKRALVFTRTKHGANKLTQRLERAGVSAVAIHGNKSQNQRQKALDAFRGGRSRVLVATDVAARGLDVDGITHVFNFNLPNEPEAYVHRIGRTGRAGAVGAAVSFCSREERGHLRAIERLIGAKLSVAGKGRPAAAEAPRSGSAPRGRVQSQEQGKELGRARSQTRANMPVRKKQAQKSAQKSAPKPAGTGGPKRGSGRGPSAGSASSPTRGRRTNRPAKPGRRPGGRSGRPGTGAAASGAS